MPDARVISRAVQDWRLAAPLVVVIAAVAGEQVWQAEQRSAALRDEVAGLRSRLADRRELIAHQRHEMAQVASAVDHLARTTGALGERGAEARRLAHMEESRAETRALVNVAATLDGGMSVMSEDAGRALEQLAWLDGQAATASDSFAVLTALVKDRAEEVSRGVPTLWPVRGLVTSPFWVAGDRGRQRRRDLRRARPWLRWRRHRRSRRPARHALRPSLRALRARGPVGASRSGGRRRRGHGPRHRDASPLRGARQRRPRRSAPLPRKVSPLRADSPASRTAPRRVDSACCPPRRGCSRTAA